MIRDISEDTQRRVLEINPRYEDNISKRMADIRLSPWRGQELDTEYRASQEARTRINVSVIFMYFKEKDKQFLHLHYNTLLRTNKLFSRSIQSYFCSGLGQGAG